MNRLSIAWFGVAGILVLSLLSIYTDSHAQNHPLSNLNADADTPLYTTYAAQMERSEFTLDQGYHFRFYEPDNGLAFTTDTGGDWLLAFKRNDSLVYKPSQMYRKPVITTSYTDVVKFHFYPFKDIKVEAAFLVYSSHYALYDITVTNASEEDSKVELISLLRNEYRTFDDVHYRDEENALLFNHEELPDGWVLGHEVPYVANVKDVMLMSEAPDHSGSYHRFNKENIEIPHQVDLNRDAHNLVSGRVNHNDGSRCRHSPPHSGLLAYHNNNKDRLLTHRSPRWGSSSRNINGYGSYNIELANLSILKDADTFSIQFFCQKTGQSKVMEGDGSLFQNDSTVRKNLTLTTNQIPPKPDSVRRSALIPGEKLSLKWEYDHNYKYHVYRRAYRDYGYYTRIGKDIPEGKFTDAELEDDTIYGYIVVAENQSGQLSIASREVTNIPERNFLDQLAQDNATNIEANQFSRVVSLSKKLELKPGNNENIRIVRGVSRFDTTDNQLIANAENLLQEPIQPYIRHNEQLYSDIPRIENLSRDQEMLYWSSNTLMRQVMLPPEGQLDHNYYVFSREPTWGWGHGGQVFHESLTMLAYAYMDPQSAMNSQRVYKEVQHPNGYINYRTGSYLSEVIEVDGQKTTSAPRYAWQNWMIYKITGDKQFLKEMYTSSKEFHSYYVSTRDSDGDGLHEWGGHAVLESVRDAQVAVWDEVAWPTNFEAMDLNTMLVAEEKALSKMADELDKPEEAKMYRKMAENRTDRINNTMWDSVTGFYYQVDKKDNDFTYEKKNDLKRKEIIGFLPLWAGVASDQQAKRLVEEHLTDTSEFWRKYGVPSLSASDPYYNPRGYWNGPVWVEWVYLIEHGLKKYGYHDLARELVGRVAENMILQLKKDHNLWEFYSPDSQWAGYHKTYIWAGIINRMLMDTHKEDDSTDPDK